MNAESGGQQSPSPANRGGRRKVRPALLPMTAGAVVACAVVAALLIGAIHYRSEREAAIESGRIFTDLVLQQLDAGRGAAQVAALHAGSQALPQPAFPDLVSAAVWGADRRLIAQHQVAAGPPVGPLVWPDTSAGERMDLAVDRLTMWRTLSAGGARAMVVVDLGRLLARVRRDALHAALLTTASALGALMVMLSLLRPQLRMLRSLADLTGTGEVRRAQPRTKWPWWLSREVATLSESFRLAREAADRRHSQEQEVQAMLQACLDINPVAFGLLESDGRMLMANRAAEQLFQLPQAQLIGCDVTQFIPPEDRAKKRRWFTSPETILTDPTVSWPLHMDILSANGIRIPIQLTLAAVRFQNRSLLCFNGVDRRSELAKTDELRQALGNAKAASEAKSRFLATLSHEIRTPLNGLSGMLDLLRRTTLANDQREYISVARNSTVHLLALLNDLLDLSKIEAGKIDFEAIPFDVQEQLGRALLPFASIAKARGLSFNVDWATPTRLLLGDPHRICQVLNNLLDNAFKFTETGGVRVRVQTESLAGGDDCVLRVRIADTGIGIPPERYDSIFEAFAQADESTTRKYGGTGLGLALSRQLCEHMDGGLTVAPNPRGGSVFSFSVTCPIAHGMSPFVDSSMIDDEVGSVLHGRRVLVVDDNRTNQLLLTRWLEQEGMAVEVAGDGMAGIRALTTQPFDVVLMDVSMPVMNGLDATRAIRAMSVADVPDTHRFATLPVIGVSANAMSGDHERCIASGMNDYVTKPIMRDLLLAKLVAVISQGQRGG